MCARVVRRHGHVIIFHGLTLQYYGESEKVWIIKLGRRHRAAEKRVG